LKGFSGGKQGISIDVPEDAGQGASVTCGGTLTLNLKAAKAEKKKPAPKKTTTIKKKKETRKTVSFASSCFLSLWIWYLSACSSFVADPSPLDRC
jgi:hypothetical protein